MLAEAASEMMAAALSGDAVEFRARRDEAVELHGLLLRLAAMPGSSGSHADGPAIGLWPSLGQR